MSFSNNYGVLDVLKKHLALNVISVVRFANKYLALADIVSNIFNSIYVLTDMSGTYFRIDEIFYSLMKHEITYNHFLNPLLFINC